MKKEERIIKSISGIYPILRYANTKGIETKTILHGTGISELDILDPQNDIFLTQELQIFRNLIEHAPAPETAWELGLYLNMKVHGAAGKMVGCAPTFGDSLSSLIDYSILFLGNLRLYPETVGKRIRVNMIETNIPKDILPFVVECVLIAGNTNIETNLPGKLSEIYTAISFAHAPRTEIKKYKEVFIDNISFNQPSTFIDIDRASLSLPMLHADHHAYELLRQQCQAEYSLHHESRSLLSDRVKLCLQTGKGQISFTEVSKQLNISERSLRRQLSKEGANFRKIRNQYFFQQSLNLLRDTTQNIEEISDALGYSETCAFTRAFQSWTGMSPAKYRKMNYQIFRNDKS